MSGLFLKKRPKVNGRHMKKKVTSNSLGSNSRGKGEPRVILTAEEESRRSASGHGGVDGESEASLCALCVFFLFFF